MPRPSLGATRSGRFINTDAMAKVRIIVVSDRIYRMHNTHKSEPLEIWMAFPGTTLGTATVTLAAGSSFDLFIQTGKEVQVGRGRGVYDLLSNGGVVRSGVIKGAGQIARLGSTQYLYRVINSHESSVLTVTAGPDTYVVAAESSMDVPLKGVVSIGEADAEGVFDYLGGV